MSEDFKSNNFDQHACEQVVYATASSMLITFEKACGVLTALYELLSFTYIDLIPRQNTDQIHSFYRTGVY